MMVVRAQKSGTRVGKEGFPDRSTDPYTTIMENRNRHARSPLFIPISLHISCFLFDSNHLPLVQQAAGYLKKHFPSRAVS